MQTVKKIASECCLLQNQFSLLVFKLGFPKAELQIGSGQIKWFIGRGGLSHEKGSGGRKKAGKPGREGCVQIVPTADPILKPTELGDWLRYWRWWVWLPRKSNPQLGQGYSSSQEVTMQSSASTARQGKGQARYWCPDWIFLLPTLKSLHLDPHSEFPGSQCLGKFRKVRMINCNSFLLWFVLI